MTEQKERELYFWLRLIREFEDRVSTLDRQGKIQGGVYSGKGQEAVVVGVCHALRSDDWIFPLHRDLGAFLVKGADPNRLMAQIFGRRDGFSKGKDSFLHGGDFSNCIFGSTSMLGSTLPVAVGTAYKFRIKQEDRVAPSPKKAMATRSSCLILNLYAVPAATGRVDPSIDVDPKMQWEKSP
ncbi:MAG: hypothetical protein HKM86_12650, partial [Deltaproteobacteria bacterium]|nr:hypothetical protein [Deltaproteobacteria bacterium]